MTGVGQSIKSTTRVMWRRIHGCIYILSQIPATEHLHDLRHDNVNEALIGLSKERPTLGDHPKAHILDFMKSGGFHVKSARFHVDFMKSSRFQVKSTYKTCKSNISRKTLQFYGVLWEGYVMFSHEIRRISKDQLPGMVSPMFLKVYLNKKKATFFSVETRP